MKPKLAVLIALLLPMLTIPIGVPGAWLGVPAWVGCSLLATAIVAVMIAGWVSHWWESLADAAEAGGRDDTLGR